MCLTLCRLGGCSDRVDTHYRGAAKQAALALGKISTGMVGTAVVPHHEITRRPDMLIDKLVTLADVAKLFEDFVALRLRQTVDPRSDQTAGIERRAAGFPHAR